MAVSIWLSAIVVFNRYRTPASPKLRQLFFSFRKMWGYPTSPISRFINFKLFHVDVNQLIDIYMKETLT